MKLTSLRIENFRSFTNPQTFYFQSPGLYFLTGDNQAEPRLGANGAGKSTIWDALCWVIYGKTLRGLKAGEVANWSVRTGACVILTYEADGVEHHLLRRWSPNEWKLWTVDKDQAIDLVDDETNPVLAHLQLNLLAATHCIFMAQQQPMFLDLPATTKASLLSEVLGLDRWLELSDKAKELTREQEMIAKDLEGQAAGLERSLATMVDLDMSKESQQWEEARIERRRGLKKQLADAIPRARIAKQEYDRLRVISFPDLRKMEEDHRKAVTDWNTKYGVPVEVLRREIDTEVKIIDEYERTGGKCPTCGLTNPNGRQQVLEMERKLNAKDDEYQALKEESAKVEAKNFKLGCDLKALRDKKGAHDFKLLEATRELDYVEKLIEDLESDLEYLDKEFNPFLAKVEELGAAKNEAQQQLREVKQKWVDAITKQRYQEFWITGFREIRLRLISESLTQLELEVNNSLLDLGLVGWSIRFDVERETKKGTKQLGFHVLVQSPENKTEVPWEVWSGGEGQRLRIAATMGLANLIRGATGTRLNLEVWDEPTQHLSGQGVDDLLSSLRNRADRENRQIWIVDHRSLGFSQFDGAVTVTKGKWGSEIGEMTV